jgi:hypothetical protein
VIHVGEEACTALAESIRVKEPYFWHLWTRPKILNRRSAARLERHTALEHRQIGLIRVADLPIVAIILNYRYMKEMGQAFNVFALVYKEKSRQPPIVLVLEEH